MPVIMGGPVLAGLGCNGYQSNADGPLLWGVWESEERTGRLTPRISTPSTHGLLLRLVWVGGCDSWSIQGAHHRGAIHK